MSVAVFSHLAWPVQVVTMPWTVLSNAIPDGLTADGERFLFIIERNGVRRDVVVELSGSLMASGPELLLPPLDDIRTTLGKAAVEAWPDDEELPARIRYSTGGADDGRPRH